VRLLWHRRDCRIPDNPVVASADDSETVLPVFVVDPAVVAHAAPPRAAVLHDALASLDAAYRDRGGALHVARGDPVQVIPALADAHGADAVAWNRDHSMLAQRRDEAVGDALPEGVAVDVRDGHTMHPPGSFATSAGDPYQVFTYYHRKWTDEATPAPVEPPDVDVVEEPGEGVPTADALIGAAPDGDGPPPGEPADGDRDAALDRLEGFVDDPIADYDDARDRPDRDGTSRLSHHLRFGTLGVREVWAATERAADDADGDALDGIEAFRRQLAWRDFYAQVLHHNPENTREDHAPDRFPEGIAWRNDGDEFAAWRRGATGYPIVDAGMRQLLEECWMHNRVRMIVASFLTKDLLIDWRWGYDHFERHLADHDPANESGGWQWAAGTGTDAQPYFRIFNPASQCETHDPEGSYVRRFVPELADAPTDAIHDWPELSRAEREDAAPAYVDPIVDHAERRDAALAAFEAARGEDGSD
jgi:deoxyribodipyrimidine photo-lyase